MIRQIDIESAIVLWTQDLTRNSIGMMSKKPIKDTFSRDFSNLLNALYDQLAGLKKPSLAAIRKVDRFRQSWNSLQITPTTWISGSSFCSPWVQLLQRPHMRTVSKGFLASWCRSMEEMLMMVVWRCLPSSFVTFFCVHYNFEKSQHAYSFNI